MSNEENMVEELVKIKELLTQRTFERILKHF